jgi:serine/threonine protein kinase
MGIDLNHPAVLRLKKYIRENPGNFLALIGAGLSMPARIPNWTKLKGILLEEAKARASEKPKDERGSYLNKLDRIEQNSDYWRDFEELKQILGKGSYENCIKESIGLKTPKIPENYKLIWKLNISGIITLNLDNLSLDSYASVFKRSADHATANQPSKYTTFLSRGNKFVFQPHGNISDSSSWIFTRQELESALSVSDYVDFLKNSFNTRSVLMLGLGTEDFSIKYLFTRILNSQNRLGSQHFVVLPSPNPELISEYDNKNISVIPYIPEDETHCEINVLLNHLLDFIPKDIDTGSVYHDSSPNVDDITPDDLVTQPIEKIRPLLNKIVSQIIKPEEMPSEENLGRLEEFYKEFTLPIHNAWLIQPGTKYDELFGYKVTKRVGKGAFGQVYEAERVDNGQRVAIKVLLPELKDHRSYLNSFRRGVRSMSILTSKNIKGMVKIKEAYEIPACIVMELIDGPTLRDAMNYNYIDNIGVCLSILQKTGGIVKKGHDLEELVLHRDLKPDNIILKNFYGDTADLEVIVLDFDLSWHKGALDLSIVDGARAQGYAAPEQTASYTKSKESTRNTAVDVFGFGMIAYFLMTGNDPRPNEQNFEDFKENIRNRISERFNHDFKSIPKYMADFICKCTVDSQEERISFASAIDTIEIVSEVCNLGTIPCSHPLLLLEIVSRLDSDSDFEFMDFNRKIVSRPFDKSKKVEIFFSDINYKKTLFVRIEKVRGEFDERNIGKYLDKAKDRALSKLREYGFFNSKCDIGLGLISLESAFELQEHVDTQNIDTIVNALMEVRACLDLR